MAKRKKKDDPKTLLGGTLNILGLHLDLGELVNSPEKLTDQLQQLRERLKQAGGKETLSDVEWREGGMTISGHIRTRGLLGEREFHLGTTGKPSRREAKGQQFEPAEPVEPPVDVFDEGRQVTILADIPGVSLEDLDLKVEGHTFSLVSKKTARRSYRKELDLTADVDPDSLTATCRNGILEVRLAKSGAKPEKTS